MRRIAATGSITVDQQYVALPSLRRAIVVVEDTTDALRWACWSLDSAARRHRAHARPTPPSIFLRRRPGPLGRSPPGTSSWGGAMTYPATQAREPVRPDIAGTSPAAGACARC